jgi:shikimate dehydrogenase
MNERLVFAVVGDPIAHSKSPRMHAAAYRSLGMPHVYEARRADASQLAGVVDDLRRGHLAGLNVTIPHKTRVLELVDEVEPAARAVGAGNTLIRAVDGRILATNTDAPALSAELASLATDREAFASAPGLVLGSGGAARAAVTAMVLDLGIRHVHVRARSFVDREKCARFESDMHSALGSAGAEVKLSCRELAPDSAYSGARAVVQATSAGMASADPGDELVKQVTWDALDPSVAIVDAVYAPPVTPFLAEAERRGLAHTNGFGMLARQGALAFSRWLGVEPPYEAMLAELRSLAG